MQVFIIMIDEMGGILGILIKTLQGITGKEFSIGFFNTPIQFAVEFTGCRFGEEMDLTWEGIKEFILSGRDEPFAIPEFGIEFGNEDFLRWDGVAPIIGFLGDTCHIAYGALVEFADCLVFEDVAAFDLTAGFVFFAIARVDADDVGEAVGVEDAFGEGDAAFVEEAEADGGSVGGVGGGWLKGRC